MIVATGQQTPRLRIVHPQRAGVSISRAQGTVVLTLRGVVDVATAGWLEHLLEDLVEGQGNGTVTVDLCRVAAVDESVLALLVWASRRAGRRGGRVVLRDPPAAVLVALDRAGLAGALDVAD